MDQCREYDVKIYCFQIPETMFKLTTTGVSLTPHHFSFAIKKNYGQKFELWLTLKSNQQNCAA